MITPNNHSDLTREQLLLQLRLDPSSFEFLSDKEKDDDELALTAVVNKLDNYIQVSTRLNQSKGFLLSVLDRCIQNKGDVATDESVLGSANGGNVWFWNALCSSYKDDKDVSLKLLDAWTGSDFPLWRLSEKMRNTYDVAKHAVMLDAHALRGVGDIMSNNVKIACLATLKDSRAYCHAGETIKKNGHLLQSVYHHSIGRFFEVDERFGKSDPYTAKLIQKTIKDFSVFSRFMCDFYMDQFKELEDLVLIETELSALDNQENRKEVVLDPHRRAMLHIVDQLSEQGLRSIVSSPRTEVGREILSDAIFKLDVSYLPKRDSLKKKKPRRSYVG